MQATLSIGGSAPVTASILFLRLRPAADATPQTQTQTQTPGDRRGPLAAIARAAVASWRARPHLVLQAPDGLALVGDVAPSVALEAARRAVREGAGLPLAIGLHQGLLRACPAGAEGPRVAGEGVATAAALAGIGGAAIVASGPFRDALVAEAPTQAQDLLPLGDDLAAELRAHAPHRWDPQRAGRRAGRRALLAGSGMVALVAAGWAAGLARERYEAAHRPGVIVLDIRPAGEVFVDGQPKGMTPPLARVPVPPGTHLIEVRSGRLKPLRVQRLVQPGEEIVVQHVFVAPPARRPRAAQRQEPDVLERFRFW